MAMNITDPKKIALLASSCAVAAAIVLTVLKVGIFWLSGSAAVLATLIDSVLDVMMSLMLFFALRYSYKPADKNHRYGHGKMEGVAAVYQAAFMAGAGLFVVFESLDRFTDPVTVSSHGLAIAVLVITIILSIGVLAVQRWALQRANSLIIEADSAHYKTDIFLNGSVILALVIDFNNGPGWVDPFMALLIAGYFFFTAHTITRKSLGILMDKELPKETRAHIEKIVLKDDRVVSMHDLRTRDCGMHFHISFDVELDKTLSLEDAHAIVRDLDEEILAHYPHAEIIIHMDPEGDTADARHRISGLHH
jgi:ferrous-iron efflux pump FieF